MCYLAEKVEPSASLLVLRNASNFDILETSQTIDKCTVCLYGAVEQASVTIIPDVLQIDDSELYKEIRRTLLILNESFHLPITFQYIKTAFIEIRPDTKFLSPREDIEVQVTITPAKFGIVKTSIRFELFYKKDSECFTVGRAAVPTVFKCSSVTNHPVPKFNMGITPEYIGEVGCFTGDVRFNTDIKKPIAAVLTEKMFGRGPHDDDLVAFPNDRPKTLRPWKNPVK